MMKYLPLPTFLKTLFSRAPPQPVGRWQVNHCHQKLDHKVDMSNEDHCGTCGQYALQKLTQEPLPRERPLEPPQELPQNPIRPSPYNSVMI